MAALTLEAFTAQLRAAFGDGLRAIVRYGRVGAGEGAAASLPRGVPAPVHLLVVVDALGVDVLRRVAPAVRAWREAGQPAPLTLTTQEWRTSADVFPMEYAEVLAAPQVLAGALPEPPVAVDPRDLRRQLEHQTLGALLHLRGGLLAAGNDGRQVAALLAGGTPRVLGLLRALARLQGADAEVPPAALVAWAGRAAGFDPGPIAGVIGGATVAPGESLAVASGYLSGLERLVAHVDALDPDRLA